MCLKLLERLEMYQHSRRLECNSDKRLEHVMEFNIGIETVTFLFRYLISFERKIFNFRLFEKPPKGQGWRVSNELKISLLLPYDKNVFL